MAVFSVSRESYVASVNSAYRLDSLLQVSSTSPSQTAPAFIVLTAYDRDEYAGRETLNYGRLSSSRSSYRGAGYNITFSLRNGRYVTDKGETLGDFSFAVSSDENRLQNLNFTAYDASGRRLEQRNIQIATRATYSDGSAGYASGDEISTVARSYVGQVWDNYGCWNLASAISASSGASLCLNSGFVTADVTANGQWTVAYSGYVTSGVDWYRTLQAGDMVAMGWTGGGGHIATVSRVQNGEVHVVDNSGRRLSAAQQAAFDRADSEDLLVVERDFSSYVRYMDQRTVVVYRLGAPVSNPATADDSMYSARMLGTFGTSATGSAMAADSVTTADRQDYYKFQLTARSSVTARLSGLVANADLALLKNSGELVKASALAGTAAETVTADLAAGTYYIRVTQGAGDTPYNLQVDQTLLVPVVAGVTETVSGGASLAAASLFTVYGQPASFSLRDASAGGGALTMNGQAVAAGAWVTVSAADLSRVRFSVGNIDAVDTVEVKVSDGTTWGDVVTSTVTSTRYDETAATARTLGALGGAPLRGTDSVGDKDRIDAWTFTVGMAGGLRLSLTGMTADADLYVYDGNGRLIGASYNGGADSELLSGRIGAGRYYAVVAQYDGSTRYDLTVERGNGVAGSVVASRDTAVGGSLMAGDGGPVVKPIRVDGGPLGSLAYRDSVGLGQGMAVAGLEWGLDGRGLLGQSVLASGA